MRIIGVIAATTIALLLAGCGGGSESESDTTDYSPPAHTYTNADGSPPQCETSPTTGGQWCNTDEEIVELSRAILSGEVTVEEAFTQLVNYCVSGGSSRAECSYGAGAMLRLAAYNQMNGLPQ
jgi:hypothetical protein